jgi:hypothetical protein
MLALVRHCCPCGRAYIVSLAGDEELEHRPHWRAGAEEAGDAGGDPMIDGRAVGFFCPGCSRLHLRVGPPISYITGRGDGAGPPYAFTLN